MVKSSEDEGGADVPDVCSGVMVVMVEEGVVPSVEEMTDVKVLEGSVTVVLDSTTGVEDDDCS